MRTKIQLCGCLPVANKCAFIRRKPQRQNNFAKISLDRGIPSPKTKRGWGFGIYQQKELWINFPKIKSVYQQKKLEKTF